MCIPEEILEKSRAVFDVFKCSFERFEAILTDNRRQDAFCFLEKLHEFTLFTLGFTPVVLIDSPTYCPWLCQVSSSWTQRVFVWMEHKLCLSCQEGISLEAFVPLTTMVLQCNHGTKILISEPQVNCCDLVK